MFGVAFFGMISHFFKKKIVGETPTAILHYFKDNFKSTVVAFIVTFVGTVGYYTQMATGQNADYIAIFTIGFSLDSMLNRWDTKGTPV